MGSINLQVPARAQTPLHLVAWEMKWINLRGEMGVFEKGLREEKSGRLRMMVFSQRCIILPYCADADLLGT